MIGQIVNYRYEVLEKCGDGTFFSVYKARDKVMNRLVAIKTLAPTYAANHDFADRLIGESQAVTSLNHPNIAKVLESDSHNDTYFTVVEYVRGVNLKDRITRTAPFAIAYAVDIAIAVAEALDYAHRQGAVHGDVRPHNILTSPEGQVKLADFGTAKALAAFPEIREATMLRSVHYTSPEVLRGEAPQPTSDIYSLGVVLFEMLTGSVPYDGVTSTEIAAKQLEAAVPSPHIQNAGIPPVLNEIVMKAMQKAPSQRYSTATALIAALVRVKEWLRTGQTPPSKVEVTLDNDTAYVVDDRRDGLFKTLAFWVLGVLTVAVATGIVVTMLAGKQSGYPMPNLIGQTLEQAERILSQTGLEASDPKYEFNDQYPEGQIYMTDPRSGGNVPRDKPWVQVWVSKGPTLKPVPNLVGLSTNDASERLSSAGFMLGSVTQEYNGAIPEDRIIRQLPRAGEKAESQRRIDIVVSLGPQPQTPPKDPDQDSETSVSITKEHDQSETNAQDETAEQATDTARPFTIRIAVPVDARGAQEVRIVTTDRYGEKEQYNEVHQPGDNLVRTVRVYGSDAGIKVYIGGQLVLDQTR